MNNWRNNVVGPTPGQMRMLPRPLLERLRYAVVLWLLVPFVLTLLDIAGTLGNDPADHLPDWTTFVLTQYWYHLNEYAPVVAIMSLAVHYAPARTAIRMPLLAACLVVSCAASGVLRDWVSDELGPISTRSGDQWIQDASNLIATLMPAALLTAVYELYRRGLRADEEALSLRTARATLVTELSRARLQALRAQVEPHFLFNTLANLRRLYQTDASEGRTMMQRLIEYLRIALPSLKRERISLREEARLIGAYLDLHRMRMGSRLHYEIAFPPELLDTLVPPMMLLTLVENAIKHGLAPLPEGGFLRIAAQRSGDVIELDVSDSGRGMSEGSGHGTGLANIRARLAALYGAQASLRLSMNRPCGVSAILRFPVARPT